MKKDIADKWVAALRSGKYKQGKGSLKTGNNKFCCLGVLCEISEENDWSSESYLPNKVREWAGMEVSNPYIKFEDTYISVLNDDRGKSFDDIADIIERDWQVL